jgi:hypothetical protein
MNNQPTFECWAVIELFGHTRIAGLCTEQNVAGSNFLRVDVPQTDNNPPFTRFLNHSAIYAINPCIEDIVRHVAHQIEAKPIEYYDIQSFIKSKNLLSAPSNGGDYSEQ